ncbi:MAG: hypothetical protein JW841_03505 [Deltaproteobacteria bacterium]|nr:hypothetical protein [Deltaproteobacteria bacterium]
MIDLLPLDSPQWKTLKLSSGKAGSIPNSIRQFSSNPNFKGKLFDSIWQSAYHQYSLYDAMFAIIPHLVSIADALPAEKCLNLWLVVGGAAAMYDPKIEHAPSNLLPGYEQAIAHAEPRCLENLQTAKLKLNEAYNLIVAAIGLAGHAVGKMEMDNMFAYDDAESKVICPKDESEIIVSVNDWGLAVISYDDDDPPSPPPKNARAPLANPGTFKGSKRTPNPWQNIGAELRDLATKKNLLAGVQPHIEIAAAVAEAGVTAKVKPGAIFSLIGALLTYKGFPKPALKYFHLWDSIECPNCQSKLIFADNWWGLR